MKIRRNCAVWSFIVLFGCFTPTAQAIDPGWYGNLGIGYTLYSEDELIDICTTLGTNCTVDNEDVGFFAGLGYKFNPYFSIEGGWQELGDITFPATSFGSVQLSSGGVTAALIGEIPLGRRGAFSLLGKVGAAYMESELDVRLSGIGTLNIKDADGTLPVYGLGAAYNARSRKFSLRLIKCPNQCINVIVRISDTDLS